MWALAASRPNRNRRGAPGPSKPPSAQRAQVETQRDRQKDAGGCERSLGPLVRPSIHPEASRGQQEREHECRRDEDLVGRDETHGTDGVVFSFPFRQILAAHSLTGSSLVGRAATLTGSVRLL